MKMFLTVALVALALGSSVEAAEHGMASHFSTHDKDQPGSRVACPGRRLTDSALVVAHRSRPCGSKVTITNNRNGRSVVATVIDRGPFVRGRVVDVSLGTARALGFSGLTSVSLH